jgi:hypothetical protein
MPVEFTNPDYVDNSGIFQKPNLLTLTGDTDFSASMLGAIVDLNGFELNLVDVGRHGVFNLVGPGTFTGGLAGSLLAEEAVSITVVNAEFILSSGAAADAGDIDGGDPAFSGSGGTDIDGGAP